MQIKFHRLLPLVQWQPKMLLRDVTRALDLPYSDGDRIAKMIPDELHITIEKALNKNPELKNATILNLRLKE